MDWLLSTLSSTTDTLRSKSSALREWISLNQGKSLFVVGSTISAAYLVQAVLNKDWTESMDINGSAANPFGSLDSSSQAPQLRNTQFKTRMQTFFRNTQRGCDNTVTSFISSIRDKLEVYVDIPSLDQLRTAHKTSNEDKIQLWEQVKIGTFTRTVSAMYGICLTLLFLRTEVNILGRYLYLDFSIQNEMTTGTEDQEHIDEETQKKYLSFYEYFLNTGLKELSEHIRKHVIEELVAWPLTRKCTLEDVLIIFTNIRNRIEGTNTDSKNNLSQYLLPAEQEQQNITDKQLNCLLNETRDVLESEQFDSVLRICLDTAYTVLADQLRDSFLSSVNPAPPSSPSADNPFVSPAVVLPLPKVIPLIRNRCKTMLEVAPQSEAKSNVVQILFTLPALEDFSSSIFTSAYDD